MTRILKHLIATLLCLSMLATSASAMFIQPDWFEPTEPGVGTNRYSYSANDPVNLMDPNGNLAISIGVGIAVGIGVLVGGWIVDNQIDMSDDQQLNGSQGLGITHGLVETTKVLSAPIGHNGGQELDAPGELSRPNIDPERAKHIIDRHRPGSAQPGATEFPEGWTEEDILDGVSGIGIDGEEVDGLAERPGDIGLSGKHKGIEIKVIVDGETGKVRTGYPTRGQEKKGTKDNPNEGEK